ncbi:MAG: MBL fold metallo-hydrolase, partial [Gammaproteobacteria bacterium]|nr:MBL fold metallo-hydrolase [Gammaproteobacteria bacterium]
MPVEPAQSLAGGITCLDADYVRPGLACLYLLQEGDEYAVIETGTSHSAGRLFSLLAERGIDHDQVRYVIPTHVHLDHAGGAGVMMAAFEHATLLIHPRGARHMVEPQRLVDSAKAVYGEERFRSLYGEIVPVPADRVREMGDGDAVTLAGRRLEFRHTRGHANHHFCVWDEATRGWFTGDMFGVCYPWWRFVSDDFVLPATTPTQFDPETYPVSLQLLGSYSPRYLYLTHHGRIDYTPEKSARLAAQVARYREIALESRDNAAVLQDAIT